MQSHFVASFLLLRSIWLTAIRISVGNTLFPRARPRGTYACLCIKVVITWVCSLKRKRLHLPCRNLTFGLINLMTNQSRRDCAAPLFSARLPARGTDCSSGPAWPQPCQGFVFTGRFSTTSLIGVKSCGSSDLGSNSCSTVSSYASAASRAP